VIRYLIDANAAVYAMDVGNEGLKARLADCEAGSVALSTISYAEVAYGTHVGKPPPPEVLEAFIRAIPLLPFDEAAAKEYARLPFKRARFDRLLAAHALSIGAAVVTNNPGDCADVPGLVIENWTV
jgi:tRNA(fMet)-specific endonuclease VapC